RSHERAAPLAARALLTFATGWTRLTERLSNSGARGAHARLRADHRSAVAGPHGVQGHGRERDGRRTWFLGMGKAHRGYAARGRVTRRDRTRPTGHGEAGAGAL